MKRLTKIICLILTIALIFGLNINAYSSGDIPGKQEVVYADLSGNGEVLAIYVVNIVEPDDKGVITDYGSYTDVRNMSTTDDINVDGDKITISTDKDKLYYEGSLGKALLPWNIEVSYYIDGEKLTAEQAAGKTGRVEIVIDISQNAGVDSSFFENMTLQTAVTLDTDICKNIIADGASIANAGKKKQLTYMLLPGNEKTFSITTDAENFEMDSILINAVVAKMNVDVDESAILGDVDTLKDAASQLNDGANELESALYDLKHAVGGDVLSNLSKLKDGSSALENTAALLSDSIDDLDAAAGGLYSGAQGLGQGLTALSQGIEQLSTGLDDLSTQSAVLTEGSAQVYDALLQIQAALSTVPAPEDISALTAASSQVMTAINQLTAASGQLAGAVSFDSYSTALGTNALKSANSSAISAINDQITLLSASSGNEDTIAVLQQAAVALAANNAHIDATETYFDALETNAADLYSGMQSLETQYATFDAELQTTASELSGLADSLAVLSASVDELVLNYADLNDGIAQYVNGVAQAQTGASGISAGMPALLTGSTELTQGLALLRDGTGQLSSAASQLESALGSFDDGVLALAKGMNKINSGVEQLYDGSLQLKDGTNELSTETSDMDSVITGKIDDMVGSISGNPDEITSFASQKNTNVTLVQFVIKTEAVKVEIQEEQQLEEVHKKSFWQKLLMLFGIE